MSKIYKWHKTVQEPVAFGFLVITPISASSPLLVALGSYDDPSCFFCFLFFFPPTYLVHDILRGLYSGIPVTHYHVKLMLLPFNFDTNINNFY